MWLDLLCTLMWKPLDCVLHGSWMDFWYAVSVTAKASTTQYLNADQFKSWMVSSRNVYTWPAEQVETMKKIFLIGSVHTRLCFFKICHGSTDMAFLKVLIVKPSVHQGQNFCIGTSAVCIPLICHVTLIWTWLSQTTVSLYVYNDDLTVFLESNSCISPSSDFQLLTIFVSGKLAAYVKFYQSNKDFIDSLGK